MYTLFNYLPTAEGRPPLEVLLSLIWGVLATAAGFFAYEGHAWARRAGLIAAGSFGLYITIALVQAALTSEEALAYGLLVAILFLPFCFFVVWALWSGGQWFRSRSAT